jgi:hypothetical protein
MSRLAAISSLGAVVFFALDSLHVRAGIWVATSHAGVPVPFLAVYFAGIFAAGLAFRSFERRHALAPKPAAVAADAGVFVAVLIAHLLVFRQEALLAAVLATGLGVRLVFFRRQGDVAIAAAVIGLDLAFELALSAAGTFRYSVASVGPLPLWLCPMWGALGLSMRTFFAALQSPEAAALPVAANSPRWS